MKCLRLSIFFLFCFGTSAICQQIPTELLNAPWKANWIQVPGEPPKDYGVYCFRKKILLSEPPASLIVHVSGDNRYKLFVNGSQVSLGPARGDLYYWNYETVDIGPFLKRGINVIAAQVWNWGEYRPEGQISNRTGFLLQADRQRDSVLNSDKSWKCGKDPGYRPLTGLGYSAYSVAGPGEILDRNRAWNNWKLDGFDDSNWKNASQIGWSGAWPKGIGDINGWMLVPSTIPQMELKTQRFYTLRIASGLRPEKDFPQKASTIRIPSNSSVTLLLDQSYLTNAYPVLIFNGGKGAGFSLQYAESLFNSDPATHSFSKGNRDEVWGKIMTGRKDSVLSDGSQNQSFTTLSWRTFRYVQLSIRTGENALEFQDIYSFFTGYPFEFKANFNTSDSVLNKILETGWRTARSCAMETYMDCPYYEQLQYIGDSRIQALVSLYNSGDDRLVRNAINQMDHSRIPEGITLSRHPSFSPQEIPTFSLWYIGLLHDYWMYRGDSAFLAEKLQGVRNILWFFSKYQQKDGSLRNVPYWMFTDWVENKPGWSGGTAPYGKDGSSSIQDLQLLWALQLAADLEKQIGSAYLGEEDLKKAEQLRQTIRTAYWDPEKKMFADTKDKDLFSQHANSLAILTHMIQGEEAKLLALKTLKDSSLAPASIYFKYYLHQACTMAGLGNDYLKWLDIWRQNLKMGLTTWAETSDIDAARSDCHAWGASPNIEFFRIVLGIDAEAPGFSRVRIEPHLGYLENISGSIPHPKGELKVNYHLENGKWKIEILLPEGITGNLLWKGISYELKGGRNSFEL